MIGLLKKVFPGSNERQVNRLQKRAERIDRLADEIKRLSDEQLRAKTDEFKQRLAKGETLDDILDEAYAVVREASTRVLGMTPFLVQIKIGRAHV